MMKINLPPAEKIAFVLIVLVVLALIYLLAALALEFIANGTIWLAALGVTILLGEIEGIRQLLK